MFTIKERCTLEPLAKTGLFARPFIVEVTLSLFNLKQAQVSLVVTDEDGLEKKVAAGTYALRPEMLDELKKKFDFPAQ